MLANANKVLKPLPDACTDRVGGELGLCGTTCEKPVCRVPVVARSGFAIMAKRVGTIRVSCEARHAYF